MTTIHTNPPCMSSTGAVGEDVLVEPTDIATSPFAKEYKMYCKSIQGSSLRTLFETLKEIIHDTCLVFSPEGIRIVTMDGSRCSLIHVRLHAENFEEFYCPQNLNCGVNMSSIFKLIRTTSSHDTVVFAMRHGATDELAIQIYHPERNSKTSFNMKLLDVDSEVYNVPPVEFQSILTLPSTYFQRIVRDMLNISDHLTITCQGGTLTLECDGDFARQITEIAESDECMAVSLKNDATISARFSLKYLSLFCRASSLCSTITMYIKEGYPLILRYSIASLGELSFALAPRIDE